MVRQQSVYKNYFVIFKVKKKTGKGENIFFFKEVNKYKNIIPI